MVGSLPLSPTHSFHTQVAARLASSLSLWRKFELNRRNLMKEQLDRLLAVGDGLSRDTYEIVSQSVLSTEPTSEVGR